METPLHFSVVVPTADINVITVVENSPRVRRKPDPRPDCELSVETVRGTASFVFVDMGNHLTHLTGQFPRFLGALLYDGTVALSANTHFGEPNSV